MREALHELTLENAPGYLAARLGCPPETIRATSLGGGVSNTVLLVETPATRLVVKQSLGKLRVEQDWFSDRRRIWREAESMRRLAPALPNGAVPAIVFEDRPDCVFGMTAAPERSRPWKDQLLEGELQPEMARQAGAILGAMIRASWRSGAYEEEFGDQTVFDELRLDPYYRTIAARHPDLAPWVTALLKDSAARRVSLVHGDWSPKNLLVSPAGAVMAIDFEVIHYGDPSFDTAFLLNHLLLKGFRNPRWRADYAGLSAVFWEALAACFPEPVPWFEPATLTHLGGLLLARIDGKSPAEYIREPELKQTVRAFARQLIANPPHSVAEAFERQQKLP